MSVLKIENISKSFKKGDYTLHVLKDFCLEIQEGEQVAIVGPSGAGKSTLLHILGGLEKPDSGEIVFGDEQIYSKKKKELDQYRNETVGFVFQFHYLLQEFTALENVMMPALIGGMSKNDAESKARALLEKVGLAERLTHYPVEMSGGEQQRTAIARALMNEPKLLLADEPTGSLDKHNTDEILNMFSMLKEDGITLVMITHDMAIADRCDRVVTLEKN